MEKTAVIILEYNNSADTINCVKSVLEYNTADVRFIVVDNNSPNPRVIEEMRSCFKELFGDDYAEVCEGDKVETLPYMTLLKTGRNEGYARGNNKGLELAYGDSSVSHVMILNSDILFVEDIIPGLLADLSDHEDAAIVSPVLYKKDLVEIDGTCARKRVSANDMILITMLFCHDLFGITEKRKLPVIPDSGLMPIDLPSGSCMLLSKQIFREIGGFDPNTFLYYEENILDCRIRRLGRRNYLDTSLKCIHLGATSTRRQPSRFIFGCFADSMDYFADTYLHYNSLQKAALRFNCLITDIKMRILNKGK